MEKSGQKDQQQQGDKKATEVEIPSETSPYVQYKDLEDYKMKAYGTEGHQEVKPGRGAGGTDAPTDSGGAPPPSAAAATGR